MIFITGAGGAFSKRAFFFSLFALAAFAYMVISMIGAVEFNEKIGWFILGCNAAFGLNYYKNEQDKHPFYGPPRGTRSNIDYGGSYSARDGSWPTTTR